MSADQVRLKPTPSQTVGPFFHVGLADRASFVRLVRDDTTGERIRLRLCVFDGDGEVIPDSLIELWQADADGVYVRPDDPATVLTPPAFSGFGRLAVGLDGACVFETIRPGRVPDGHGGLQAPHVNLCIFARGLLRPLFTRVYFAGDDGLDDDAVLAQVPADRRETLLARKDAEGTWALDIRLQGEGETVFFAL